MNTRMRSPRYPGTPLAQAIDNVAKIHKTERTNPIDREVAAQAMGYSGLSGRSAKILADLTQYGLLERGSKNEVRVSKRAVEILHPESPASKLEALAEAAYEPELFQRVRERFPDAEPSEASLRSFFVREEFTDRAIPSAIRAYMETCEYLEQEMGYESHGPVPQAPAESVLEQPTRRDSDMQTHPQTDRGNAVPREFKSPQMHLDWGNKRVWVSGHFATKASVRELIEFANAVMPTLQDDDGANRSDENEEDDLGG